MINKLNGALLGRKKIAWQDCNYVLRYFGEKKKNGLANKNLEKTLATKRA